MMQDWNDYRDSLLERVGDYAKQSPDMMRALMTIDGAAAKTGYLEPKIHELIPASGIFCQLHSSRIPPFRLSPG